MKERIGKILVTGFEVVVGILVLLGELFRKEKFHDRPRITEKK
jgi:hypothetical protein